MGFLDFFRANARWLAVGFLLTFFSSFGQTFFIALSGADIRAAFALSNGGFGALYMAATLTSAATLPFFGRIVDTMSPRRVLAIVLPALAAACVLMAIAPGVAVLFITLVALRLFGQGMMTHVAFTLTGRWFVANRGRAVSVTSVGNQAGEALLPVSFVVVSGLIGWRESWIVAAAILIVVAFPVLWALLKVQRTPQSADVAAKSIEGRQWRRAEVMRDPLFWIVLFGVLAPPFIGTSVFFHQTWIAEIRGWPRGIFAAAFPVMSAMTFAFTFVSGTLIDRFSAVRLLPFFLLPLALACFILAGFSHPVTAFAAMAMFGLTYGFSSTLFGALWPEVYGTAHLGAVRAVSMSAMVFATALGPGVTGVLIDLGVGFPSQLLAMGVYCLFAVPVLVVVSRRFDDRRSGQR